METGREGLSYATIGDASVRWRRFGWLNFPSREIILSQPLPRSKKLEWDVVSFEGEELAWFQWEDGHRAIRDWLELKRMILERF